VFFSHRFNFIIEFSCSSYYLFVFFLLQFGSTLKSFQREITNILDDIQNEPPGVKYQSPRGRVYTRGWVPRIDRSDVSRQSTIRDTGFGLGRSVTYRPVTAGGSDGSSYAAMRAHCLQTRTLWEDPDFQPVARSLFYKRPPSAWPDIQWKRPHVSILFLHTYILTYNYSEKCNVLESLYSKGVGLRGKLQEWDRKKGVSSILIKKFVMIVLTSLPPAGCSMLLQLQPGKHGRQSYEVVFLPEIIFYVWYYAYVDSALCRPTYQSKYQHLGWVIIK